MKAPAIITAGAIFLVAFLNGSSGQMNAYHRRLMSSQEVQNVQYMLDRSEPLVLRSTGSNLCLESGSHADFPITFSDCGAALARQSFVFIVETGQLEARKKQGYCVDYGNSSTTSSPPLTLQACSTASSHQKFAFDLSVGLIKSVTDPELCLDSTNDSAKLKTCVDAAMSQVFSIVAAKDVEPRSATSITTASGRKIPIPDRFHSQLPFLLVGKHKSNLCLSDGGRTQLNGNTTFEMATCGNDTEAQTFVYDPATLQIKSVSRPGLCINDGKGQKLPPFLHLEHCATKVEDTEDNQQWILDESTSQLVNPNYLTPMCADDGSGLMPGQSKVYLDWCRDNKTDQAFQIQPTTYVPPVSSTSE